MLYYFTVEVYKTISKYYSIHLFIPASMLKQALPTCFQDRETTDFMQLWEYLAGAQEIISTAANKTQHYKRCLMPLSWAV